MKTFMYLVTVVFISTLVWMANGVVSTAKADETTPTIQTRINTVSLFKNGLGFIRREAEITKGDCVVFDKLPIPIHGTFWVYPSNGDIGISDLIAYMQETIEDQTATTIPDLLEANIGTSVQVRIGDEDIRCKLVSIPTNRQSQTASNVNRSSYNPKDSGSIVLLQTSNMTFAANKSDIKQIGCTNNLNTIIKRPKKTATIKLRTLDHKSHGKLAICYLSKGITWIPSCMIDIADEKKAHLTAKAEVINEMDDIENVTVNFITGFPNLQFSGVVDPIAMSGDLASFLNSLQNPQEPQRHAAVMQQRVMMNAYAPVYGAEDISPTYSTKAIEGQTSEDLFFYSQKDVMLKKGERGYYPLYAIDVPYEHVYEWKIGNTLDENEHYRSTDPKKAEEIWHSIRLTNTGSLPWTTAPAMTMQHGQMLGQDIIYYTSPGAKTIVKITQAIDVKAEQAEFETERKRNAANYYGYNYDLVNVQGKLKAVNYKDKDIKLTITKDLSGEVISNSPAGSVTQVVKGLKSVNPNCVLVWELPIKARDKAEIEYQYKVYVRN